VTATRDGSPGFAALFRELELFEACGLRYIFAIGNEFQTTTVDEPSPGMPMAWA
jgi:hypothetical protein